MTDIQFGRLTDLPLREAWKHEAHEFTPWLAENIDHLSEAIGLPLELTGTEVAVESFSADILARNPMDDSVVLIENQLEQTDHTHLGQIMTYLAGLEAQTVVWIAPAFREPHLSAIRWLNEHTSDGFSFFAVKARVVRIGDSPFAPIFEIVGKPDRWQRKLKTETEPRSTGLREQRLLYFDALQKAIIQHTSEVRKSRLCFPLPANPSVFVVAEIQRDRVMTFLAYDKNREFGDLELEVLQLAPNIERQIGPIRETKWGGAMFVSTTCDLFDAQSWGETIDWHSDQITRYLAALVGEKEQT